MYRCILKASAFRLRSIPKQVSQLFDDARNHFSTSSFLANQRISGVKELSIPTPYGKIAAKAWGSESGKPVLAFHGWFDNCGTFDSLIPLLSNQLYIVAIDAPGHGLSSHKPLGCLYSDLDNILEYSKVVDYLGWKKFGLMGHSFGGSMALMFACLNPDLIEKVVTIDVAKSFSAKLKCFPELTNEKMNEYLKLEDKLSKSPTVYTHKDAVTRLLKGMQNEITAEGAEILLKRGSKPSQCGKGVVFSRDIRCQTVEFINSKNHELIYQYLSAIKSEIMILMATNTHPYYRINKPDIQDKAFEIYRQNAKRFVLEHVDGNHFVHLNTPERVAPLIDNFFIY